MRTSVLTAPLLAVCTMVPWSAWGQVDPSGAWRTWHTEHFRIHAKAAHADHAVRAAREAERAYFALSTELTPPRDRIDLVLSDAGDFSNGSTTVFPSNRINVTLTPPTTSNSLGVYDDWLRLVITHELTHVFHLERSGGIWRLLQRLFGRAPGLFPNTYQPGWVAEGLATYYEYRFSSAGRLRGAYHTQLLAATARDGTWPSPGDADRVNPTWPAGTRPYAWGSRFFDSQRTLFGDSVVPRFIERTSRQLIVFNVSRPLRGAGGESVSDGWERLELPANEWEGPYHILERGLRAEPEPRVSPGGALVCFRTQKGKSDERIVVRDIRTGRDVASKRGTSVEGIAWVGDTVYVAQLDYSSPVNLRSDLYRWEPGRSWERLSFGARHADVFRGGNGRVGLVTLEPGERTVGSFKYPDTTVSALPVPSPADDWGRVAVSRDGMWVAAARHAKERWDIVLWPAGRPDEFRMVTDDAAMDADPVWSDADGALLFASERSGLPQIYQFDIQTGRTVQITDVPTGARGPAVVDSTTLLFSTVLGDGFALVQGSRRDAAASEADYAPDEYEVVPTPDVEVRESGYRPWPALRPHFWIPVAHDEGRSGLFLGAVTIGADPILRTSYGALVAAAPKNGRMEGVFYVTHKRWKAWNVDVTAEQTWDYSPFRYNDAVVPASYRERAAELGIGFSWRRWRTGAGVRLAGFVERDELVNEGSEALPFTPANPTFAGGTISGSVSHYSRPALSISPENGVSLDGLILRRWQVDGSRFWSYEARGGVSGYLALPMPGFAHWVLAASVTAGKSGGNAAATFSVGGESGDILELIPGTALSSGRRRFQLRGYDAWGGFTKAVVGAMEIRIPIALVAKGVPSLPLFLDRFSLSLFGEVGSAWNEHHGVEVTGLKDVGGEVTVDLGVGAGVALRARVGGAAVLSDGLGATRGDLRYYLAFGRAF